MEEAKTYNRGESVPEDGKYVCVPCGYQKDLHPGEVFPECISCLAGTDESENEGFAEGLEMWEKVDEKVEEKAL